MKESLLMEGHVMLSPKESQKWVMDMAAAGSLLLSQPSSKCHNQQFHIIKADFGQVYFKLRSSGKVLTVANQSEDDGARIVEEEYSGKANQKFRMQEMSPQSGEFIIYTFCGKAVDVCNGSLKQDTPVFQYSFNGGANQLWKVRPAH